MLRRSTPTGRSMLRNYVRASGLERTPRGGQKVARVHVVGIEGQDVIRPVAHPLPFARRNCLVRFVQQSFDAPEDSFAWHVAGSCRDRVSPVNLRASAAFGGQSAIMRRINF